MGYFDKEVESKKQNRILLTIIGVLLIVNMLAFKAVLSIASNKTVVIEVPQFMESGKYVIGNTFASDSVYKMWTEIFIRNIAEFSYKNVREKVKSIFPYLDPQTAFENKAKLMEFIKFIENNFITQSFSIKDITIEKINNGMKRVIVTGVVKRKIGKKQDKLDGFKYSFEFIMFVRNGQIYINSIKSYLTDAHDQTVKRQLMNIESVDYTNVNKGRNISDEIEKIKLQQKKEKEAQEKREALQQKHQKGDN